MRSAADAPPDFLRRPPLAFRVGITGARRLEETALSGLRRQLTEVLAAVRASLLGLMQQPEAGLLHAADLVLLRMISPLAEGADRLAAVAALALGYRLEAPLPFSAAAYERDFPETVSAFRALLAAAEPHVLALDGARGDAENRSYEAVGRLVVRNCDLLLAIWDGGKSRGQGGTAEIVEYAAGCGLPVWWIRADGLGEAGWLHGAEAALHPAGSPNGAAASSRLEDYLRRSVLPGPAAGELQDLFAETPAKAGSAMPYRLLAETLRMQRVLAQLAWSLPPADETCPAGWYFNAMRRAEPLPRGNFGLAMLTDLLAYVRTWLREGKMNNQDQREHAARLDRLRLDLPLASQELGAEILALAETVLQDHPGWAELFAAQGAGLA